MQQLRALRLVAWSCTRCDRDRTRLPPRPLPLGASPRLLLAPPSPLRLLPLPAPLGPGASPACASICALARRMASAYAAEAARPLSSCAMTAPRSTPSH